MERKVILGPTDIRRKPALVVVTKGCVQYGVKLSWIFIDI